MSDLTRPAAKTVLVAPSGSPLDSVLRDDQNLILDVSPNFVALSAGQTQMQTEAAVRIADIQRQAAVGAEEARARPALWLAVAAPAMFFVGVAAILFAPPEKASAIATMFGIAAVLVGLRWRQHKP